MLDFSFSSKQKMTAFYLGYFKAKMVVGIFPGQRPFFIWCFSPFR